MPTSPEEARFADWLSRHLRHLRETFMEANGITSKSEFAKRVGVDWKTIWSIEGQHTMPGVDMLNQIVKACDSNLGEFFSRMIPRMELAAIERDNREEAEWIEDLVKGLSHEKTKRVVQGTAATVREFLAVIER